MIDLDAPDPFGLAAWRANRLPTNDPRSWLLVLSVVYDFEDRPPVEHYRMTSTVARE